jgi:hypothetical protein
MGVVMQVVGGWEERGMDSVIMGSLVDIDRESVHIFFIGKEKLNTSRNFSPEIVGSFGMEENGI